ncbi:MAG: aspartate--tRNA ligase [Acidimicrobiales bacterium]|jgi:aspartyl-tRNA synthetase|nr:aspartate--tRNA ligase [Acidimicrobiaceae bacterium]HBA94567.1 aspartate--tRNA ligase [Acidimicrobiaceae bacterium]HIE68108.1 aspartate--tRNA ligase [Acidimicrobiia bacterium]HIL48219.1 aspartate--tRNA ligase [Acidimicrobiia bacterium]
MRTDRCGDLRADDVDRSVTLCGWVDRRREHGEHLAFIDLRDRSGVVQLVIDGAHDLRSEYVLQVTGNVRLRPNDTANQALPTGAIEIDVAEVTILSTSDPLPFPLDDRTEVDEVLRLRHRYLDLRRSRMQRNLEVRARVNSAVRTAMEEQGFIEVETPMLIASTPEGARDFVVPSRKEPGSFYALPQSPQLFKQLCMVGGIDRYYQIARCLRDEDLRADRQFEFMQLDAEASFVSQDDVLVFISHAVASAAEAITGERPGEIPRMSWLEAMERFGTDKPDIRFGMELVELTEVFAGTEFRAFQAPCVKGIRVPGGAETSRNRLDEITDQCRSWGAKGLVWMKVTEDGLNSPVAKFLTDDEQSALAAAMDAEVGDLILIVADERRAARHILGLLRIELGRPPVTEGGLHFLWVVDFPLFEGMDDAGNPIPAHHPFTMPHPDDMDALDRGDLLDVRSQAYDLVLNGWELGSGSVRIHQREVQEQVFGILGIGAEEAQSKFGFLLDAFRYGPPPHAGFAFGMDRLTAILAGEENIREVIAYPKTQSGADPLTGAPTAIDDRQLEELGLRVLPPASQA